MFSFRCDLTEELLCKTRKTQKKYYVKNYMMDEDVNDYFKKRMMMRKKGKNSVFVWF